MDGVSESDVVDAEVKIDEAGGVSSVLPAEDAAPDGGEPQASADQQGDEAGESRMSASESGLVVGGYDLAINVDRALTDAGLIVDPVEKEVDADDVAEFGVVTQRMGFDVALGLLKQGAVMTREEWERAVGAGPSIRMVPGALDVHDPAPGNATHFGGVALNLFTAQDGVQALPTIMFSADGAWNAMRSLDWKPAMADLLAEDWKRVA